MAIRAQERVEEIGRLQRMRVEGSLEGVAKGVVEEVQGPEGAIIHLLVGGGGEELFGREMSAVGGWVGGDGGAAEGGGVGSCCCPELG